jgi:hypothetical protein
MQIRKIAPLDIPVLIQGESGTGKELMAQALHMMSPRQSGRLITINAAALPASLVESELYGYEAGSFAGADKKGRAGKFEAADKGTMFLDEIGDMPIEVQSKLLRVLRIAWSSVSAAAIPNALTSGFAPRPTAIWNSGWTGPLPPRFVLPDKPRSHRASSATRARGGHPAFAGAFHRRAFEAV